MFCVVLGFGALIGLHAQADSNGIFVQIFNPFSSAQQPLLTIEVPVQDCDIQAFKKKQSAVLAQKVGELEREGYLAALLRDLRDKEEGPFKPKQGVGITVPFTQLAQKKTVVYARPVANGNKTSAA